MEDTLKRLLEAERRAEAAVEEAKAERERMTREALEQAHHGEQRFQARVPEIHDAFVEKAKARAEQTVAELQRRYAERNREYSEWTRDLAAERREDVLVLGALGPRDELQAAAARVEETLPGRCATLYVKTGPWLEPHRPCWSWAPCCQPSSYPTPSTASPFAAPTSTPSERCW